MVWEYQVSAGPREPKTNVDNHKAFLDQMGMLGWELLAIIPSATEVVFYFKRPCEVQGPG